VTGRGGGGRPAAGGRRWWLLGPILLVALGLRLYRLGAQSLWYDETVSVYLASQSIPALVAHTAGDIHPPGYYLLLHLWRGLAGRSDFAAAFFSLFFGLILVVQADWLGRRVFGRRAGLLAALLVALSPYHLWYSQEVRMYTLGAACGMVVLGATLHLMARAEEAGPGAGRRGVLWALGAYVLAGAAGLWVLYYFAFLLVALNLMVAGWWLAGALQGRLSGRWLGRWALAQAAVLLLYAPWLPVAWRQATQPPVPPWRGFVGLGSILVESWTALSLGQSVPPGGAWLLLLFVAALFALGLAGGWSGPDVRPSRAVERWLLAGALWLPVLLIYVASFLTPLYHVRYVFTYSTPFYVLIGAGLVRLGRLLKPQWQWLQTAALIVLIAFCGASMVAYHTDPAYVGDDHRGAVQFLARAWRPGDAILVNAGYTYPALLTYWQGDPIAWRGRLVGDRPPGPQAGPVVVQSGTVAGEPSLGWGDPASDFYAMSAQATDEALARLFSDFHRVWVYRLYDTVTDPAGHIRGWLEEQGTLFLDQVFSGEGQLRVQGYATGREGVPGSGLPGGGRLADGALELAAAGALPDAVAVGGALDVALFWRVTGPLPADALLFVGLYDEAGRRWAQADEQPLGPLFPPGAWPVGEVVRTPVRVPIPAGTPPGRYGLEVGWYRFVEGQPMWLAGPEGERLAVGAVAVEPPEDWWALPAPAVEQRIGVTVGSGVRLEGLEALRLEAYPGETVELDLLWRVEVDRPPPGPVVLQVTDDAGRLYVEQVSAPAGGRAPFASAEAGQLLRDPWALALPGDLPPGVYNLSAGRRGPDGSWLEVRRGGLRLGSTHPLATIRVEGRPVERVAPAVAQEVDARFGDGIRLVGYDLQRQAAELDLVLYWQALAPMAVRYKIFVHLVANGDPSDIRAQADRVPHLPTTGWVPGEYLRDRLALATAGRQAGCYGLLVGLYDEVSGERLPVAGGTDGAPPGSLLLEEVCLP
jgi:4-amino-4-deoxy-L-arabinose transferase-like glycosyltransferase